MFEVTKVLTICAGHQLDLPYPSKCTKPHGHNYRISVTVASDHLNPFNMVCDFKLISNIVKTLDHTMVEDHIAGNATAERISAWIFEMVQSDLIHNKTGMGNPSAKVIQVEVGETDGNVAVYKP